VDGNEELGDVTVVRDEARGNIVVADGLEIVTVRWSLDSLTKCVSHVRGSKPYVVNESKPKGDKKSDDFEVAKVLAVEESTRYDLVLERTGD